MHPPLLNRLLSKTFAFQSIVCAWQSNKNRRSVDKLCIFTFLQTSFRHGETALEKFSHINGRPVYLFIKMPYCLLKTVSLNVTSGFILVRTKATDKGFVRMSFHLHNEPSKHFIECTQNPRRFVISCLLIVAWHFAPEFLVSCSIRLERSWPRVFLVTVNSLKQFSCSNFRPKIDSASSLYICSCFFALISAR